MNHLFQLYRYHLYLKLRFEVSYHLYLPYHLYLNCLLFHLNLKYLQYHYRLYLMFQLSH